MRFIPNINFTGTQRRWLLVACVLLIITGTLLTIVRTQAASKLDAKLARKLIAHVAGVELASDAVKVKDKDISLLGSSATVVAQIETAFRFVTNERGEWRVAEIRTGNNKWEDVDMLVRAVNQEKAARARAELETLAVALKSFRRERGFYPITNSEAVLVDQLNPRYTMRIVRVDPWHNPYIYKGTGDRFELRSTGADGKLNTADDVAINQG
ncbi:MAG: type II secretion system protein GspG [Pyrinomonadaceae bacterium]